MPNFLHLIQYLFLVLNNLGKGVGSSGFASLVHIIKAVQLLQICFVGFLEVALDVGKVNNKTVTHTRIRTVYTCYGLKQIVVFQFAPEIQAFQAWRIKTSQKHIKDNENIHCHIFLEVFDYLLTSFFVIRIVKNDSGFQRSVF